MRWRLRLRMASAGFAASALFGDVQRGARVVAELGQREHVDGVVELAVAAGIQAVAIGAPGADRDRCAQAPSRASCASLLNRSIPAISPISLAAISTPPPGPAS